MNKKMEGYAMDRYLHLKRVMLSLVLILTLFIPTVSHARRAFITIKNTTDGFIRVYTNGKIRGFVRPRMTRMFPVSPGRVEVKIVDRYGKTFTRTFVARPGKKTVWTFSYPANILRQIMEMAKRHMPKNAHLFLENRGGTSLRIYINGRFKTTVGPYDSVEITVPAGRIKIEAKSGIQGTTRIFRLRPGEFEEWSVYLPETQRTGKISIRNGADVPLEVFVNDNYRGTVQPGEIKIIITESRQVTVTLSDGTVERSRTFQVRPGESVRWQVGPEDFASPPQVKVVNTLAESADVYLNGSRAGRLEPGEEKEFDLKPGLNTVELRAGETSQMLKIRVHSGDFVKWEPRLEY